MTEAVGSAGREGGAAGARGGPPALEVLGIFTRLGLTSFGGPIAHLGYFHEEIVRRRRWVDEVTYADLVALCQFLPGPASSQVGFALGLLRAGYLGGLAAWTGFTLPSAAALVLFAFGVSALGDTGDAGWLHGLKVVAVAVVAQAVWSMATRLCPDRPRATLAILAAIAALALPTAFAQVGIIALAGLFGWRCLGGPAGAAPDPAPTNTLHVPVGRRTAVVCWVLFFGLLIALPLLRAATGNHAVAVADSFYRAGALVFGGGHVVLPLLQSEVVPPGWTTNEAFVAGYGAAQAVPGPLFTFAAYLGAVMQPGGGVAGAALALGAIYVPAILLVIGALPFWSALRQRTDFQAALRGVNAGVVGLLLAALYQPVWTSAVQGPGDAALALAAFGLLQLWKLPPWRVVVLSAAAGAAMGAWRA